MLFLGIAMVLASLGAARAHAGSFYYEFGGGVAKVDNAAGLFGPGFSHYSSTGTSANGSIFYSFQGSRPFAIHLGLSNRFVNVAANGGNYSFNGIYPALRLQFSLLYFGGGITPLTFIERADGNFRLATSALAYYAEAGILYSLTPLFSLGASGAAQFPSEAGRQATSYELGAVLRFYFNIGGGGGDKSSSEYKGWRYPFGQELH